MTTDRSPGAKLDLVDLCKQYPGSDANAVDHANLTISPGEFVTLLGPSGSGKTTTLNMIAGLVDITSGRIDLNGSDISALPPNRRNFGMVFQNYALFPHMTVFENVAFPLKQRRFGKEQVRSMVANVLDRVDLVGKDNAKPSELSGGQQQRVAVARAIVFSPGVLLLDEPLGALDRKLRQGLQAEIKRIHREFGLTFVFVTHDQEEAMYLSDRIAVFNQGRIECVGTPADLYQRPRTRFVAEFLGESNVFVGSTGQGFYQWRDRRWSMPGISSDGSSLALSVRPERLKVLPEQQDIPPGMNGLEATVTSVGFMGFAQRLELRFEGDSFGCAIVPPDTAQFAVSGMRVNVAWDPAHQSLVSI